MRVAIVTVLCALGLASAALAPLHESEYRNQFVGFVKQYNKAYSVEEMFAKFNTFKYWVDFVRNHNAGNHTWEAGINEFSDLMPEEFNKLYLSGLRVPETTQFSMTDMTVEEPVANDIDWRSRGLVTGVKNQGSCGSCWAFSATGVMEGFHKKQSGSLPNLSEQQLVDCSGSAGNHGCQGGWPSSAITWAAKNGGSCSQGSYPYTGRDGACKRGCTVAAKVSGARTGSGENTLVSQLNNFPVSVAIDASGSFQSYRSGVFSGPCSTQLNHAVLAVGYTGSYFIVKNSWGTGWGSGGYIMMARGRNLCGINNALAWAQ